MTYLSYWLGYIDEQQQSKIVLLTEELSKIINAFSRTLNKYVDRANLLEKMSQ